MAGLCEGGNEPLGSLKAICNSFQFQELGCKNCKDFQSVYNRVKKYYAIKCQQHNLSAVRYLTFDPSGKYLYLSTNIIVEG
ncbi:hypothetical protein ANN_18848 [Periplaneta americana]|uniref:Uncharacterized protein n=1 Tax=Periplaneta americana TaxID=6978 RepID=A0ABQ8SQM6_PERAM|nr:hypothetical protein ANN_18848 [Periplaneta americana]